MGSLLESDMLFSIVTGYTGIFVFQSCYTRQITLPIFKCIWVNLTLLNNMIHSKIISVSVQSLQCWLYPAKFKTIVLLDKVWHSFASSAAQHTLSLLQWMQVSRLLCTMSHKGTFYPVQDNFLTLRQWWGQRGAAALLRLLGHRPGLLPVGDHRYTELTTTTTTTTRPASQQAPSLPSAKVTRKFQVAKKNHFSKSQLLAGKFWYKPHP